MGWRRKKGAVVSNNTNGIDIVPTAANSVVRIFSSGIANERVRVAANGNVGIGTTAPASRLDLGGGCLTGALCSDARMKRDIRPITTPLLDRVERLQPSTFAWNARPGRRVIGMVAQQVEEIFPEVVTTSADGREKGLECTGLAAIALQAIKEQQRQIADLRRELSTRRRARAAARATSAATDAPTVRGRRR